MFYSMLVSDVAFRILIHFEFIFVHVVKECSSFFFVVYVLLLFTCSSLVFPEPFIEETVLPPFYNLVTLVLGELTMGLWVYF